MGAGVASAATYYVVSGGTASFPTCWAPPTNVNDPTQGCPLRTAINAVKSNDTVVIEPGPNNLGGGTITTPAGVTGVTIRGVDAKHHGTISDYNPADKITFDVGKGVSISDLDINYGTVNTSHLGTALRFAGDLADRIVARSRDFAACNLVNQGTKIVMRDSACVDAARYGLWATQAVPGNQSIQLENVTAVTTDPTWISEGLLVTEPVDNSFLDVYAVNTIAVAKNGFGVYADAPVPGSTDVTLAHSNYSSLTTDGSATIAPDDVSDAQSATPPVFVAPSTDPMSFNFHESSSSPTVGAGALTFWDGTATVFAGGWSDVDGDARRITTPPSRSSVVDIGADQTQG
jgi:hypothetical protein